MITINVLWPVFLMCSHWRQPMGFDSGESDRSCSDTAGTLSGGRIYFGRPKVPLAVTVKQQKIMIQNSNYGSYIIIRDGQLFLE